LIDFNKKKAELIRKRNECKAVYEHVIQEYETKKTNLVKELNEINDKSTVSIDNNDSSFSSLTPALESVAKTLFSINKNDIATEEEEEEDDDDDGSVFDDTIDKKINYDDDESDTSSEIQDTRPTKGGVRGKYVGSSYIGVFKGPLDKNWRAKLKVMYPPGGNKKKVIYLGSFITEIEAAEAYDQAKIDVSPDGVVPLVNFPAKLDFYLKNNSKCQKIIDYVEFKKKKKKEHPNNNESSPRKIQKRI
jgi:hypothetical protein